jgi:hypothetical protein
MPYLGRNQKQMPPCSVILPKEPEAELSLPDLKSLDESSIASLVDRSEIRVASRTISHLPSGTAAMLWFPRAQRRTMRSKCRIIRPLAVTALKGVRLLMNAAFDMADHMKACNDLEAMIGRGSRFAL